MAQLFFKYGAMNKWQNDLRLLKLPITTKNKIKTCYCNHDKRIRLTGMEVEWLSQSLGLRSKVYLF